MCTQLHGGIKHILERLEALSTAPVGCLPTSIHRLETEIEAAHGVNRGPRQASSRNSENVVYEGEYKNEFKRSSKDARGRLGTLDDDN